MAQGNTDSKVEHDYHSLQNMDPNCGDCCDIVIDMMKERDYDQED